MSSAKPILVVGASARAACFSAARAGFSPVWIDLFGDHDLAENFPGERVPADTYPGGIAALADGLPPSPFIYTGALENHLSLVQVLQNERALLGNPAEACSAVRDPLRLAECFTEAGIRYPGVLAASDDNVIREGDWLIKPRRSAGGTGIRPLDPDCSGTGDNDYLQEYIPGDSFAGVFVGDGREACLLGVTRQLVGEAFLHAGPFAYCGSIGPLTLNQDERDRWQKIGNILAKSFGLRGLFGVDAVIRAGEIYPVEVNPRYTASVEVMEQAMGTPFISLHCKACEGSLPSVLSTGSTPVLAKAYLFAPYDLRSPDPVDTIYQPSTDPPYTADIPRAGTIIKQGHPLMTIVLAVSDVKPGMQALQQKATLLYQQFERV